MGTWINCCDCSRLRHFAGSAHSSDYEEPPARFRAPATDGFPENICRPKPVRPLECDSELIRLANSLSSLASTHRLSPSDSSAFRIAEAVRE